MDIGNNYCCKTEKCGGKVMLIYIALSDVYIYNKYTGSDYFALHA